MEMGSFILIFVNGFNGNLPEGVPGPFSVEKHILLVFKPVAGNMYEPIQRRRRKAPETCLGIPDFQSGIQGEDLTGQRIAQHAAAQHIALEGSAFQHNLMAPRLDA